jgi:hypothetical protein
MMHGNVEVPRELFAYAEFMRVKDLRIGAIRNFPMSDEQSSCDRYIFGDDDIFWKTAYLIKGDTPICGKSIRNEGRPEANFLPVFK